MDFCFNYFAVLGFLPLLGFSCSKGLGSSLLLF
ncbi:putative membrane protein, partial [Chlamydia psittaci 02DC14]